MMEYYWMLVCIGLAGLYFGYIIYRWVMNEAIFYRMQRKEKEKYNRRRQW